MHVDPVIEMVTYLGRKVPRNGFRTYVYSSDGQQRLANSWDEFDALVHSDTWFSTKDEAQTQKKPRKKTEG